MSHLHFIGGEKGGVGKSLMSRLLAQYCIDCQLPFAGFDTDRSHGTLRRFYADYVSPVAVDLHDGLDRVIETAAGHEDQRVVIDLAAQTDAQLTRWMESADVPGLAAELNMRISYWHVMDAGRDSVDLLLRWLERWGGKIDLIVVLNEVRGADFAIYDKSGLRERAQHHGAQTLVLPHLHDATMQKIDAQNTSFWAALQAGGPLGMLERQRVKVWLQKIYASLDGMNL